MTFSWGTIAFIFIGYIMLYSVVNRICQCVEACSLSKAFATYLAKSDSMSSYEKFAAAFTSASKAARTVEKKGTNE